MKILVTGGTGYIGSHTCINLLELGSIVIIFDIDEPKNDYTMLVSKYKNLLPLLQASNFK